MNLLGGSELGDGRMELWEEKKGIPESNHHQKKKWLVYPSPSSTSPLLFCIPRGTEAALLCLLRSSSTGHPYPVHQPLPRPGHHLHHLHQRHHHVSGALQPAPGEGRGRWNATWRSACCTCCTCCSKNTQHF